jgi:hypothetical protein
MCGEESLPVQIACGLFCGVRLFSRITVNADDVVETTRFTSGGCYLIIKRIVFCLTVELAPRGGDIATARVTAREGRHVATTIDIACDPQTDIIKAHFDYSNGANLKLEYGSGNVTMVWFDVDGKRYQKGIILQKDLEGLLGVSRRKH